MSDDVAVLENSPVKVKRRLAVGAEVQSEGGVHFRVWAPRSRAVAVKLSKSSHWDDSAQAHPLAAEPNGYFSGLLQEAEAGVFYKISLDSGTFPDPVSRFQPQGVHGPSQVIDPNGFAWTDGNWKGVGREGQVIYELHVGTFTQEGTWKSAMEQLPELAKLGVTVVEMMPVAEFPGRFGWGYDGVDFFAPTHLYGEPDDLRAFVDRAHGLGLGVILDVVYNHFGPDGCYLKEFSNSYFTDRYQIEWGEAINFDGEGSGSVREFFVGNALYWMDEFHFDGFRFDATQLIFDASEEHILREITRRAREAAGGRSVYLSSENEDQQVRLVRPMENGYGMDALWNDDFHHAARVALTGHNEAYYTDYKGSPQEFISAVKWGYLFQGQWHQWRQQLRGTPTFGLAGTQFVNYLENHDQIANSLRGERLSQVSNAGDLRALTALLLLGPGTPLLFQGQEFGASAPFLFFSDQGRELTKLVRDGRRLLLSQFFSIGEATQVLDPPDLEETFTRCKLDFSERVSHASIYQLHRDLIALRRTDPVFCHSASVDGAVLGGQAFVIRFFGEKADGDRLLLVNLGMDLLLKPAPEPLLAPGLGQIWKLQWSSEEPSYGGGGTVPLDMTEWWVPGHAAIVLEPGGVWHPVPRNDKRQRNVELRFPLRQD